MRFFSRNHSLSIPFATATAAFAAALLLACSAQTAHAQATGDVTVFAGVEITPDSGLALTGTAGSNPLLSNIQQGTGKTNIQYANGVDFDSSPNEISTQVRIDPTTGTGSGFNRAQVSLLFTPSITFTNVSFLPLSFTLSYSVTSFAASVNATPNLGTALSSEAISIALTGTGGIGTLSNFSQSLSRTNGAASDGTGPTSVSGTFSVPANSAVTITLRTSITADNQYNPTVSAAAPEPGSIALLALGSLPIAMCGVGVLAQRRRGQIV